MSEDASLEEQVERLRTDLNAAVNLVRQAKSEIADLEDELAHERQRRKELEQEVEKLADDRELLNTVRQNAAGDRDTQAAICILALTRQARKARNNRYTMDSKSCVDTLQGEIHRTNTYDVFRRAEQLIDDTDVVWFAKEDRGSKQNSRLVIDLDGGSLPAQVAGVDLTEEATA